MDTITADEPGKFWYSTAAMCSLPTAGINEVPDFGLPPQFTAVYNAAKRVCGGRDNDLRWDGNITTGSAGTEGIYFRVIEINGLQFGGNATPMRK